VNPAVGSMRGCATLRAMRLDHVSYAAEPDGLLATTARLSESIGVESVEGGVHPRFGTRNRVLPLRGGHYVEVVEVLDHPAADKVPFGQAVRARSQQGGGWLAWVLSVDDMAGVADRLGRAAVAGNRRLPDGTELRWQQVGVAGLLTDGQLPFFISWGEGTAPHPSRAGATDVSLVGLQIAGDRKRVSEWLGGPKSIEDVDVDWVAPHGEPGLLSVTFASARGTITV
jgi:Glyoxalase-like domain